MLYYFLADQEGIFNLFRYLTFRTGGAVLTALVICFIFGPKIIRALRSKQKKGQPIRADGPESHIINKAGTPTMGGFMILLALSVSTLLWADISNPYVWIVLSVTLSFGAIGFYDDYKKVTKQTSEGLSGKVKFVIECAIAGLAGYALMELSDPSIGVPGLKDFTLSMLPILYIPFIMLVVVGAANSVNLTDGLDGLATMPVVIAASAFGLIAYIVGNTVLSGYLGVPYVAGSGELAVFCGALIGACLGFLWFNAPPAMVFMGDTGSLALGGALGSIAAVTKHEIILAVIGGIFVLETVSVIVQVLSFKLTGKRVFRMAPIHHHFEQKGWAEPTIVIRFWIISLILALVGLASLKLR
ncbi:phospho-N-acetylmuramoyl-pentapeptide-transferase [Temperatibacter marinus]|uniref:Phospho-N-acetylmuramoyl-pentapeptide-transferase n=1 Tax=Temperatibacter marinus TaxID=1456591 RepID=A0AA52EB53_9PROT|nr:phospho-N-acetylmuramoyl-pentapeptide-transferase [Temperatibacter marinus]WND01591.1 phospho-N-acetylmuramoyl-pentapeptide-transferase [Temperatibacter marinus]